MRFIRLRISGGVTSKNERQRSVDTSLSSTVLSAARVKVAPQRCLIGLLTKSWRCCMCYAFTRFIFRNPMCRKTWFCMTTWFIVWPLNRMVNTIWLILTARTIPAFFEKSMQIFTNFLNLYLRISPKTKQCSIKAQSTKIGCAFSLPAPYSEERRKAASEAAKQNSVNKL